jgi:hypothetical protein
MRHVNSRARHPLDVNANTRRPFGLSLKWVLLGLCVSSTAFAEGQWLTLRGRLVPETRFEVWGGPRTAGVGLLRADDDATAAWSAELLYAFTDRVVEARGARVWQISPSRFATASVNAGTSVFVVSQAFPTLGLGPTAGVTLGLGGKTVSVDLGLQTGVDAFVGVPAIRFPERASLGLTVRIGDFAVSAMARAGADFEPGHTFVFRGDFMISLEWLRARPAS